jgi:hypothetical protein
MSESHDAPKFDRTTFEERGTLADADLEAVSAGTLLRGSQQGERKGGRYLGQI